MAPSIPSPIPSRRSRLSSWTRRCCGKTCSCNQYVRKGNIEHAGRIRHRWAAPAGTADRTAIAVSPEALVAGVAGRIAKCRDSNTRSSSSKHCASQRNPGHAGPHLAAGIITALLLGLCRDPRDRSALCRCNQLLPGNHHNQAGRTRESHQAAHSVGRTLLPMGQAAPCGGTVFALAFLVQLARFPRRRWPRELCSQVSSTSRQSVPRMKD